MALLFSAAALAEAAKPMERQMVGKSALAIVDAQVGVLAGAATNWCIRATAYAAVDRGYNLALVSDAHSTESMQFQDGRVVSAESIVTDLNVVFEWLRAPNARTEVVETASVGY